MTQAGTDVVAPAKLSDNPALGPPSLGHLYYFATTFDRVLIGVTFFLYLACGAVQGSLNLVMASALSFGPQDKLMDVGLRILTFLSGYLAGMMFAVFTLASIMALYTKHRMMEKWKVGYVKAILRQDIGWYDVNQAQSLAGRMGECMQHIDAAFAVPTYQASMFLGNILCVVVIAFVYAPVLAAICLGFALVLVGPASFVLARTISTRTRLLSEAYSSAGGFAAEILGAVRTVASLGLERFAIERYDETLATAEKVAVRTTARLALSLSTITAFVFYVCAAASMYSLSIFEPQLRDTGFTFAAPVAMPGSNGSAVPVSLCVPSGCGASYDPFLLAQAIGADPEASLRFASGCPSGYEAFQASCASGQGLADVFELFPEGWLPQDFTETIFKHAGASWPCGGGISFEIILIVMNSIIFAFLQLPQIPAALSSVLKATTSAHASLKLILREPSIDSFSEEGIKLESVRGAIDLTDVVFAYPASPDFKICNGYSLSIPAGTSCALVGPSGAGKSTIIGLLQRFYDPQSGRVTLDGHEIQILHLDWLRRQFGLVGQEPVLFQGTVAENIRYGREGADKTEIEEAARQANALDFIKDLSDGFETEVGQGGSKLSGGQKQRVAIARAIIKRPAVLMLDEATSALDYKSEQVVQEALDKILTELKATCIVIAHRLSTIRHCDKIAVVNAGRVVEEGTYDELLAIGEGGLFYALANKQEEHNQEDREAQQEIAASEVRGVSKNSSNSSDKKASDAEPVQAEDEAKGETKKAKQPSAAARLGQLYSPTDKKRVRFGLLSAIFCGVASGFMGLVIVNASFTFRDEFDPDKLRRKVTNWAIVSVCIGVFLHVLETFYKIQFAVAGEALTRRLRVTTLQQLLHQELGYFDEEQNSVGELTEFLAQKVNLVQGVTQDGIQGLLVMLSVLITAIVISVVFGDWRIMLIFVFGYIFGIVVLVVGQVTTGSQEERYKAEGAKENEETSDQKTAGALVGEVVASIKTVISFNAEKKFLEKYATMAAAETRKNTGLRMYLGSASMGVGMGGIMFIFGFSLYYGFFLMEVDIESFMDSTTDDCSLPLVNTGRLMVPMMSFISALLCIGSNATLATDAKAAKQAADSLFARIDRPSLRDPFSEDGEKPASIQGDIEVRDVHFAYPTRPDFKVCRGYNLSIRAGTVCALVGPSGAGKSTIVSLLLRFYDPQSGVISIDGKDITSLNLTWLRSQLGLVGQEPVLFQGTVADNIRYGKEGSSQSEIEDAAKQANAHGFITDGTLGAGYDTQVGLRGGQLSGGQKQRVAIARALVRQPTIMLLDEATSALDSESERVVQEALDEIMTRQKRTTIVIAHRLSTIRDADQIAVINRGRVEQTGTHEELRAKGGLYAELLAAQSHGRSSVVGKAEAI